LKKKDKKKRKSRLSPLAKIAIALAIAGACAGLSLTPIFNVEKYEVEGNSYYTDDEILVMGNCKTGGNMFWDVDTGDIKKRLSKDSYMAKVKVKRIIPNTIRIQLTERKQYAAVVYGDHYVVMDDENIVLRKTDVAPKVPVLQGITINKMDVGAAIEIDEKVKFQQMTEFLQVMEDNDMYYTRLVVEKAQIKAYVLDNLVCVGSAEDLMESMKKGELQKVIKGLFDLKIERGTVKVSGGDYISFSPEIV